MYTTKEVTVIIPSYNTLPHLKNTYESLKRYAPEVNIIIIDDASEDGTAEWLSPLPDWNLHRIISSVRKGHTFWYDEGMRRAKTEIVSILHSDMIIGPNYFENMLKHLQKGKVVCATRIEPPIHPAGKEKIVRDFGDDADKFKWEPFEKFVTTESTKEKDVTTKGIFAPWTLFKEDHLSIGGHDQRFAPYGYEDSDIFNRWILAGYEMIQSRDALCYHMTCRGHRWNKGVGVENPDYRRTMDKNAKEFIRKWGDWIQNDEYQFPIINPKYDIGIQINNTNSKLLEDLEPWCSNILIDDEMQVITSDYLEKEQKNTIVDLSQKIKTTPHDTLDNDTIVLLDGKIADNQDLYIIKQLPKILKDSGKVGEFRLGNLFISIKNLQEQQNNLIQS